MAGFDAATAARRDGDGYAVALDPDWFVVGPNGGYLASVLLRALTGTAPGRPPRSLTVQYATAGAAGPARVTTSVERAGRSMSFLSARLTQDGTLVATALAACGTGRDTTSFQDFRPAVTPAEDLETVLLPGVSPAIAQRFDYRPLARIVPFSGADSEFECWVRLREPRPLDAVLLATLVDALAPAMMFRATVPTVVPTLDLTVHFRHAPPPGYDGWCLARARTRTASEGFVEEDCEIYSSSGTLLAQSRQLALLVPFA
jgi:acyl-CoA thioesterase